MVDLNKTNMFNKNVISNLKKEYLKSMKNSDFEEYIRKIRLPHETLMKYTSRLETCFKEQTNCSNCKGLEQCKNEIYGFYLKEELDKDKLIFEYKSCKYKNKEIKDSKSNENVYVFDMPSEIKNARMKDIYIDDKNRKQIITWLTKFIHEYDSKKKIKGLYLNGNFGCGKTYLISATFNELSKRGIKSAIIYWPEFLRSLKESFSDDFKEKFNYIKKVPLLLIDDIGAENVTLWGRDEILGTILQYRMEEGLTTFFTSNLTYEELESALSLSKSKVDSLKATRIMERIKNLTVNMNLIGENRRN